MTDYNMTVFSDDDSLPLHVSKLTKAQLKKFGKLSVGWPRPVLDSDGYVADDDLAREVLREKTDDEHVAALLKIAAGVPACEASRRIATEALALASAADLPHRVTEAEGVLARIEHDTTCDWCSGVPSAPLPSDGSRCVD